MATAVPNFLEGPTYIAISRYSDGETWLNETKMGASLQDAIEDVDNTAQVFLLEDGKYIDVSVEAAELWWALNSQSCDTAFDVPQFIHDQISNQVYSDISESRYNANAQRMHEQSFVRGL